jgi:hypothetical protein
MIQVASFALLLAGISLYAFGLRGKAAVLAVAVLFAVSAGLSYGLFPGVFVFAGAVTGAVAMKR